MIPDDSFDPISTETLRKLNLAQMQLQRLNTEVSELRRQLGFLQGHGNIEPLSRITAWKRTDSPSVAAGTAIAATAIPAFVGVGQKLLAGGSVAFHKVGEYIEIAGGGQTLYDYVVDSTGGGTHTSVSAMITTFLADVAANGDITRTCWLKTDDTARNIDIGTSGSTPLGTLIIDGAGAPVDTTSAQKKRASLIFNSSGAVDGDAYFKSANHQLPNLILRNIGYTDASSVATTYFINVTGATGWTHPIIEFHNVEFFTNAAAVLTKDDMVAGSDSYFIRLFDCLGALGYIGAGVGNIDIRVIDCIMSMTALSVSDYAKPLFVHGGSLAFSNRMINATTGAAISTVDIGDLTINYTGSGTCISTSDAQTGTRSIRLSGIYYTQSNNAATFAVLNSQSLSASSRTDYVYVDDLWLVNTNASVATGPAILIEGNFDKVSVGYVDGYNWTTVGSYTSTNVGSNGIDHHLLADLTGNDDHTQYALLTGRGSPVGNAFAGWLAAAGDALTSYHSTVAGLSPVGYWKMNDTGSPVLDSSGNSNSMTATLSGTGALTYQVAAHMNGQLGVSGYATGANKAYLHAADAASLHVGDVFSVVASIKKASNGTYQCILDSGASAGTHGFEFRINSSNKLSIAADGSSEMCTSTTTITDTNWHLVAVTKTGATIKLYIDGVDVTGAITNVTITDGNQGFSIGHMNAVDFDNFSGTLSEITLYNVALSAANITSLYTAWTSTAGATPNNTTAGDLTGIRVFVNNDSNFKLDVQSNNPVLTLDSGDLYVYDRSGNQHVRYIGSAATDILSASGALTLGYLRAGSLSAPVNVTAGDLTAVRLSIGNVALGATSGYFANLNGTMTDTASGAKIGTAISFNIDPAASSASEFRSLLMSVVTPSANTQNFTQIHEAILAFNQPDGTGNYTGTINGGLIGVEGIGVNTSAATGGAITAAVGLVGLGVSFGASSTKTVTTARGIYAPNPSLGGATVTTYIGIDIDPLSHLTVGTGRIGLRNADISVYTPSAAQTISLATNTISASATVVMISNTTAGSITLTSAPTIANGSDGQLLTILNVGTQNVVLQDQGTLASSNLRLTAAAVTLAPRNSVMLMYSATVGDWVQVGNVVAVL